MNSQDEKCQICLTLLAANRITLSCSHFFCKPCLEEFCNNKINLYQVGENSIICPSENCGKPINYYQIREIVSQQLFEKYDQQVMELCNPVKNERQFICPKCNYILYIPAKNQISYVKCMGVDCGKTWCTNEECMGDWKDHANLNCEEYKLKFASKMLNEKTFNNLVMEKGWKNCPICGVLIEKIKNCNYVRCESAKCQKKTIFCYICGINLKENEINTHYQENNNFKPCIKNKNEPFALNHSEEEILKKEMIIEENNKEIQNLNVIDNGNMENSKNSSKEKFENKKRSFFSSIWNFFSFFLCCGFLRKKQEIGRER